VIKVKKTITFLMVVIALAILCGCGISKTTPKEISVAILGEVIDRETSDGIPAEIKIYIHTDRGLCPCFTSTDEEGRFNLNIHTFDDAKLFRFVAESPGYQPQTIEVKEIKDSVSLIFRLERP
jgi:hypothetical protein